MSARISQQLKSANRGAELYLSTENLRIKFLKHMLRRKADVFAVGVPHPDVDKAMFKPSIYRITGMLGDCWPMTPQGVAFGWSIGADVDIWSHITINGEPFATAFRRYLIQQGIEPPPLPKRATSRQGARQKGQHGLFPLKSERAEMLAIDA